MRLAVSPAVVVKCKRPAAIQRGLPVVPVGIVGILRAVQPRRSQGAVHRVRAAGVVGQVVVHGGSKGVVVHLLEYKPVLRV